MRQLSRAVHESALAVLVDAEEQPDRESQAEGERAPDEA